MTTRRGRPGSRRVGALVVVVALVAIAIRLLDASGPIFTYRVIDDYTLGIGTVTGPGTWTRVTAVTETSSSISVTVNSLRAPLPGTGDDILELRVTLSAPIGGRTVIDANGLPVPRSGG